VKSAALLPGQPDDPWPVLRPKLLAILRKRGDWSVLIDIFLEEGEVAKAIEALKAGESASRDRGAGWGYGWAVVLPHHYTQVAAAAETAFPDEAIAIYRRLADEKIAARQRSAYQEAATYLARIKQVFEAAGRAEEWPSLIAELRQQFKNLRALREELDALGLA
jgi:hypothetical protein